MIEMKARCYKSASEALGFDLGKPFPDPMRDRARDVLVSVLEETENICARDSIRIAHAWITGRKPPTDWRYK